MLLGRLDGRALALLAGVDVHRVRRAVEQAVGRERDGGDVAVELDGRLAEAVDLVGRHGPSVAGTLSPAACSEPPPRRRTSRSRAPRRPRCRRRARRARPRAASAACAAAGAPIGPPPARPPEPAPPVGGGALGGGALGGVRGRSAGHAGRRDEHRAAALVAARLGRRARRRRARRRCAGRRDGLARRRRRRGAARRLGDEEVVLRRRGRGRGRSGPRGARDLEAVGRDLRPLLGDGAVDGRGQLGRLRVARRRILGRRARDDLVEGAVELRARQARRRRRVGDVRPQLRHVVVLRIGDAARQHLVQHAAQRVDVGAAVDRPGLDLLGGDVVGRADPRARAREAAGGAEPLGQPEVGQVDVLVVALAADQDVGRLDVAVHQAALVRGVERRGDRGRHALHAVQVELALVDDVAQVRAGHEAHRQVEHAVVFAAAVDRDDVRVLQRGRQPRLGLEAGHRVGVLGVLRRDDLQRHGAVELGVGRLVDDPHPAAVEHPLDRVARELRARLQSRQAVSRLIHRATLTASEVPRGCQPSHRR